MSSINDLISVQFEDQVLHDIFDSSDVLGIVMPYHWGPENTTKVYNSQEFFEAYPEAHCHELGSLAAYKQYAQVKSYFQNGGSKVAVYRPACDTLYEPGVTLGDYEVTLKYTGAPALPGQIELSCTGDDTNASVSFIHNGVVLESFTGQCINPEGVDPDDGETTYLPEILEKKSKYFAIHTMGEVAAETWEFGIMVGGNALVRNYTGDVAGFYCWKDDASTYFTKSSVATPGLQVYNSDKTTVFGIVESLYTAADGLNIGEVTASNAETLYGSAFAGSDSLLPTQFVLKTNACASYQTASFYVQETSATPWESSSTTPDRFTVSIFGSEKIKVFNNWISLDCCAGVAGADARVAADVNLNQLASAKSYGSYAGILTHNITFDQVLTAHDKFGVRSVYTSNIGPQIFGVRNSFNQSKPSSYFAKFNVTRVVADILRKVKPLALEAIHTQTAADAILRAQFEARLNSIIEDHISRRNLQDDSVAICNETNNSDAQTQGGQILNIILSCHFIGLVERVRIKVVATDSSITTNFA